MQGDTPDVEVGATERDRTLRRRHRALRQQLSRTATSMFLAKGFDAVRVADIAKACGVSTKTVWNHFPTKESLLFDRGEALAEALTETTGTPHAVLEAVMQCIRAEIDGLHSADPAGLSGAGADAVQTVRAFVLLVQSSPALQASVAFQVQRLTSLAVQTLATGTKTDNLSPRNQILAGALIGLWQVHLTALLRHALPEFSLKDVQREVLNDVEMAHHLIAPLFDS